MENSEFHNLSRDELDKFIDDLILELKSRSGGDQTSESGESESEAVDKSAPDKLADDVQSSENDKHSGGGQVVEESIEDEAALSPVMPSEEQAEALLKRINYRNRYRRTLISTVASLIIIVVAAIVISIVMPVIRISGGGMEPVYHDGDILVLYNSKSYTSSQLCCVSWQNKLLIRRIIGMSGDIVDIDVDGNVYVNGALIDEPYAINKSLGECDIDFPYEVPDGQVFLIGDRRDTSIDSRSTVVGCIGEEQIVGRVLFRVWPLSSK